MPRTYIRYIAALLLYSMNGIIASYILLSSYDIVFYRALIGMIFLGTIFVFSRKKPQALKNKKHFLYIVLSGVCMGVNWLFLYEAYDQIGVSLATLAYFCGPIMVVALSPFVFGEKLTLPAVLGLAAVVTGMICANGASVSSGGFSWGLVCGLLAAVGYAAVVIFSKKASSIRGLENSLCQLIFGFSAVAVFVLFRGGPEVSKASDFIIPILVLGIVNTGITGYLYFSSLQRLPAQSVAICSYLQPTAALIFSALILGEQLTPIQLLGAALIIGGAAGGEFFGAKRRTALAAANTAKDAADTPSAEVE